MTVDPQHIYLRAPEFIQNWGITFMGFRQFKQRYNKSLPEPYDKTLNPSLLTATELKSIQNRRLQQLINHAHSFVPYYNKLFRQLNIAPTAINIDNFSDIIPILEKPEVVAKPENFFSASNETYIKLFTSGTSGSPMPILCTKSARSLNYAFFRQIILENGSDVRSRSATFAGRVLFGTNEKQHFWRKDYFNKTLLMSSYHISDATIPGYISALESWKPEYIDSYPSAISEIARHIIERKIQHSIKLKFILTSSETLSELQREQITDAFGCPIVDQYGCTEMAISAHSTSSTRYHVNPLYSLVEFEQTTSPNTWSVICTGLLNFGMPLIRYRIGDAISGLEQDTIHHFCHQSFESVLGREDDLVITPEGHRVGRLDPAFKGVAGIKQSQIIQTQVDQMQVKVVPAEHCDKDAVSEILVRNLQSRTSPLMKVTINFVDSITLSRSGKLKSVISMVNK